MTQKEFGFAMRRGLGRCVMAVESDPERYRKQVLWACTHNFAYDPESEGTRAWYAYRMVCVYPDRQPFVEAAASALVRCSARDYWKLGHLSAFLSLCAMDGDKTARRALKEKYRALLSAMENRQRRKPGVFYERDSLEQICVNMAVSEKAYLRIASDLGRLYMTKSYLNTGEFQWLYISMEKKYKRRLLLAAKTSAEIACFIEREEAGLQRWTERKRPEPSELSGVRLALWLKHQGDAQTIRRYAEVYRMTADPQERANALNLFACCPYPDDPAPVLADAMSLDEKLSAVAWAALEEICHPAVREFALRELKNNARDFRCVSLLTRNYQPEDAPLLERLVEESWQNGDTDQLHDVYGKVLEIFRRGGTGPKRLLPRIYETNPCSFCRLLALKAMSKRRMLTGEILEECLCDCNDEIRQFAACRMRKKQNEFVETTLVTT